MKTLIFLLLASFWGLDLPTLPTNTPLKEDTLATEGTNFRDLSFDEALAAARAEGKLLFVDCYTTWCGPCKNMAEKVFPQKAAGDYFNPRFVCIKIDIEKGEGVELAKRWEVHAYPTFLIFRPDGTIQHRMVGGGDLESFIARTEKGLNPETNLEAQKRRYAEGNMDNRQLLSYWQTLAEAADPDENKVYEELIGKYVVVRGTTYTRTLFCLAYVDPNLNHKDQSNRIFLDEENDDAWGVRTWAMSDTQFKAYLDAGNFDTATTGDNAHTVAELRAQGRIGATAYSVTQYFEVDGKTVGVRTSGYSKFSDHKIDKDVLAGSATVDFTGILTLYDDEPQITLIDEDGIHVNKDEEETSSNI